MIGAFQLCGAGIHELMAKLARERTAKDAAEGGDGTSDATTTTTAAAVPASESADNEAASVHQQETLQTTETVDDTAASKPAQHTHSNAAHTDTETVSTKSATAVESNESSQHQPVLPPFQPETMKAKAPPPAVVEDSTQQQPQQHSAEQHATGAVQPTVGSVESSKPVDADGAHRIQGVGSVPVASTGCKCSVM